MDKRAFTKALGRRVVNPIVSAAVERGIAPPSYAILETTGRRSGQPRRTPVGNGLDGDTFWIVAEHGRRSGFVRNVQADPRVRVRTHSRWRDGVAHLMADDDPRERQRLIGRHFNAAVVRAMGTELLTIRVDLAGSPDGQPGRVARHAALPRHALVDGAVAGAAAALLSGAPSTLHALLTGADPLEATLAAGTLVLARETRPLPLLVAALPAHAAISLGWGAVLAVALPRRRTVTAGALAGLAIAALDLGVIGRRFPRIHALPTGPQVADHVAYGMVVGAVVAHRRTRREDRR